ncbi:hypothetical protein ACFQZ4_32565 [Catellatospora coxensis]|uniref:Uncharacterized protein n=1 Tax=Catellatospora coxensis TaxID=310354 RepID=A0A8J3PBU9_9ACTN|nr:hypothetical protein [Catellatospora coxensis]GIG10743.1 hypothetical protein Cco03nite_74430 [Catellatospora coxensis]
MSEARLKALLDAAADIPIIADPEAHYRFVQSRSEDQPQQPNAADPVTETR